MTCQMRSGKVQVWRAIQHGRKRASAAVFGGGADVDECRWRKMRGKWEVGGHVTVFVLQLEGAIVSISFLNFLQRRRRFRTYAQEHSTQAWKKAGALYWVFAAHNLLPPVTLAPLLDLDCLLAAVEAVENSAPLRHPDCRLTRRSMRDAQRSGAMGRPQVVGGRPRCSGRRSSVCHPPVARFEGHAGRA